MKKSSLLIAQSVRENRKIRTADQSVVDDLAVECSSDCDSSETQIGWNADDSPILGREFWGGNEGDGPAWTVVVESV